MDIFKNREDFNTFSKQGFDSGPYINSKQVTELQELYNEVENQLHFDQGCNFSVLEKDIDLRTYIHNSIISICKPSLDKRFKDYKFFIAHLIVKKPYSKKSISLHQDPMFTDQAIYPAMSVWTALGGVDEVTGKFGFINHAVDAFPPFQTETLPQVFKNVYNHLNSDVSELALKAGDGIYFDNRMIHYTHPNISNKTRVGLTIKIAHKDAENLTLHRVPGQPNAEIKLYKHHDSFYADADWVYDSSKEHGHNCLGVLDYEPYFEDEESIKQVLQNKTPNKYQSKSIKYFLK